MKIPQNVIDEILSKTDIVNVISEHVTLKGSASNVKGLCPFHNEKTPSFTVSPDKQVYYCFGCQAGGNVISFLMEIESLSFREALTKLASPLGIDLEPYLRAGSSGDDREQFSRLAEVMSSSCLFFHKVLKQTAEGQKALEYLKSRGINQQTIEDFKLGYAPGGGEVLLRAALKKKTQVEDLTKTGMVLPRDNGRGHFDRFRERIMFPIQDVTGRIVAFGGRILSDKQPKYLNSPETPLFNKSKVLYGLDFAKKHILEDKRVIVVEGYMDFLKLYQEGLKSVVATLGTALSSSHALLLKRFTGDVIILYDTDNAGQNAALRGVDTLTENGLRVFVVCLPELKDPDEFVSKLGVEALNQAIEQNKQDILSFKVQALSKQYDLNNEYGKAKVAELMFETIASVDNAIVQAEYLRRLAGLLDVPEKTIMQAFEAKSRSKMPKSSGQPVLGKDQPKPLKGSSRLQKAEDILLRLALSSEQMYQSIVVFAKEHGLEFESPELQAVLKAMEAHGHRKDSEILSCLDSELAQQKVSSLLLSDFVLSSATRNMQDCLKVVLLEHLDREEAQIKKTSKQEPLEMMRKLSEMAVKRRKVMSL